MKNNSLKKSLLDKSKKLESLELELNTNTNSNTNLPHKTTDEIIDSVQKSTYYYKRKVFWDSPLEKEVYFIINNFINNNNVEVEILPHVSLKELFNPTNDLNNKNLKRLSSYHIDILLLSKKSFVPLVAIEIDGSHHDLNDRQKIRDAFKNSLLKRHNIKLLRLKPDNCTYSFISTELTNLLANAPIYCPKCGNKMVEKNNSKTGVKFLGCSGYNSLNCEYSQPIDYKIIKA